MQPIRAACNRRYLRKPVDGKRPISKIRWVVIHSTETGENTAEAVARNFQHSTAGYTHLTLDEKGCWRSLNNGDIPRAAPGANLYGFHIEQVARASWPLLIWKKHRVTLDRAAYKTAVHCRKFKLPVVFCTAKDLKKGQLGVTTHAECTKAFGGNHTDPGRFWPRTYFMARVRKFYDELGQ